MIDDEEGEGLLFVGDDWSEGYHDVELMDAMGRRLAKARLPEEVAGMARLHAMIGEALGEDAVVAEVAVGIETDRGPWVAALAAAGYVRTDSRQLRRWPSTAPKPRRPRW